MIEVTTKLKERFCKDCKVPINLFKEPYFSDRIVLYDCMYNTIAKYDTFVRELEKYTNEQCYLEDYNRVKDSAINSIKCSEGYERFNSEDMNKYGVKVDITNKDIYKVTNDSKEFISIDIVKANFSSLREYNPEIFGGASTWEEFISKFTYNKHIINSKYIRQVIMGNCNPKRQVTYEKYIMKKVLDSLGDHIKNVVFFSNDEIVLDITNIDDKDTYLKMVKYLVEDSVVPLKIERFTLHKIKGVDGFYKEGVNGEIELKCVNSYTVPFILRKIKNEEVTLSDRTFYHEGLLAEFKEIPNIEVID